MELDVSMHYVPGPVPDAGNTGTNKRQASAAGIDSPARDIVEYMGS